MQCVLRRVVTVNTPTHGAPLPSPRSFQDIQLLEWQGGHQTTKILKSEVNQVRFCNFGVKQKMKLCRLKCKVVRAFPIGLYVIQHICFHDHFVLSLGLPQITTTCSLQTYKQAPIHSSFWRPGLQHMLKRLHYSYTWLSFFEWIVLVTSFLTKFPEKNKDQLLQLKKNTLFFRDFLRFGKIFIFHSVPKFQHSRIADVDSAWRLECRKFILQEYG